MEKFAASLLITLCLTACAPANEPQSSHQVPAFTDQYALKIDAFTAGKVDEIIRTKVLPEKGREQGDLIASVSSAFLGTPYQVHTLTGSWENKEALVADFRGVDCFTLIDYVQALTRAENRQQFLSNLIGIRYVNRQVDFSSRKHFFTDWYATAPRNAVNVTSTLGGRHLSVIKRLNGKTGARGHLPGVENVTRKIDYIPAFAINKTVLDNLQTGDYVGIYSPRTGLDVSHVGIVIKEDGEIWFRNASSLTNRMKVEDSPFMKYMASKPGIIVLRSI